MGSGVTKIAKVIAGETRDKKEIEELWKRRRQQQLMNNGHKVFGEPGCPVCGHPLAYGMTVAIRRAWFCGNPECRFFDTAVVAVYVGTTDNMEHFRNKLWHDRFNEPLRPLRIESKPPEEAPKPVSKVQWKVRMG